MTKSKCQVSRVTSHEHMRVATAVLGVVIVSVFLISPMVVLAADEYGLDTVAGKAQLKGLGDSVPKIVGRFLGAGLSLVGILFFILTIYGGVLWMTSHGNAEQASKGLKTAIAAIIGLVIVLAAYTITNFVFKTVEGGEGVAGGAAQPGAPAGASGNQAAPLRVCVNRSGSPCSFGRHSISCNQLIECAWNTDAMRCEYREECGVLSDVNCQNHEYCRLE